MPCTRTGDIEKKIEIMEETLLYLETKFCFSFEGYVWAGFKVFVKLASFMHIREEILFKEDEDTVKIRLSGRFGYCKEERMPIAGIEMEEEKEEKRY